jgi:hypothetical protein
LYGRRRKSIIFNKRYKLNIAADMNEEQNNKLYSAADIEQYLAGNLSASEMHALEKAALNDPFLAEAIEGFESVPVSEWKSSLENLKKEFAAQHKGARIIPLQSSTTKWWRIAAAVFLLSGAAALTYTLTRTTQNNGVKQWELAENKSNPVTVDSPVNPLVQNAAPNQKYWP